MRKKTPKTVGSSLELVVNHVRINVFFFTPELLLTALEKKSGFLPHLVVTKQPNVLSSNT